VFAHSTSDESVFAHSTNRVVSDPAARPPKDFDLANPYVDGRPSDGTGLAAMAHENHVIREKFIKIEMAKVRSQSPPPTTHSLFPCHRGTQIFYFSLPPATAAPMLGASSAANPRARPCTVAMTPGNTGAG
jgi:hypothetical protein